MTPAVEQLVRETIDLTGSDGPALLRDDAPVLAGSALARADPADAGDFYLVGIIGGKDVGKSAIVNALAGRDITATTSHGPGTEVAVAYAHVDAEPALRAMLEREVPGRFRIVTHELPDLRRQVLLDLPDIDSHYKSHLAVTRAMLRHMLYPVWVQSIEKYADLQPQQMLAAVAAGNDARNFIFCLNKADQLDAAVARDGGPSPANELREDFAVRIARTLSLPTPPQVLLVSAKYPTRHDMPALRELLARQKSGEAVRVSKERAGLRQDRSLLDWVASQGLAERAERLGRLRRDAEELAAERLAVPLIEQVIPRIADDPATRAALTDEILVGRVARWPLVTLIHTLLSPLFALARTMGAKHAATLRGPDALVDYYLKGDGGASGGPSFGWSAAAAVRSTFAQLRQSQPALSNLYGHNKLWEDMEADAAAGDLSRRLAEAVERQRKVACERLAGRHGVVAPLARWLLTLGALLWFPIVQPVLEAILKGQVDRSSWQQLAGLLVQVLGVNYLLKSAGFLLIWFLVLWLALRWNTQRRVSRLLGRWRMADDPDPTLNLATQCLQWVDGLTEPVRLAHERTADLARRADTLRGTMERAA